MPQGGKKTPFSGKLKKAQLQAKRERKVYIYEKVEEREKHMKRLAHGRRRSAFTYRQEEEDTWANTPEVLVVEVVVEKETGKKGMLGRAVTSRYIRPIWIRQDPSNLYLIPKIQRIAAVQ